MEEKMKNYCLLNGQCRRKFLLTDLDKDGDLIDIDPPCSCCDICA